jgi:hypothetical protein
MRVAAANPRPFQFDVAATSSIPSLLPKISVDPAVAAQGAGRFTPANFRMALTARRSHSHGETDKSGWVKLHRHLLRRGER